MRNYALNQTDAQCFVCLYAHRGEYHHLCHSLTDKTRQTLSSRKAGNNAETGFGLAEYCSVGSNAHVKSHCYLSAAAECVTIDCCDGRLGHILDLVQDAGAEL